jgi:thioredoxin reductase (NADPH)
MPTDLDIAFPVLASEQIEALAARGHRRAVAVGDRLWTEGERGFAFFVVLAGRVEIVENSQGQTRTVTVHELPEISETLLRAFLTRRSLLLSDGFAGLRIIGSRFSPEAHALREFASRNAIRSPGSTWKRTSRRRRCCGSSG